MLRYERLIPLLLNTNQWEELAIQLVAMHETDTNARLEFLREAQAPCDLDLYLQ